MGMLAQVKSILCIFVQFLLTFSEHNLVRYCSSCGPGSSVGIATDYGLDSPGSNPGGDEIFRPSRPALGPPSLL